MPALFKKLKASIGQEAGRSSWITVDQAKIDAFAEVTGDHQFIHVDPVAAAKSPFGGTIAHGFLTLSLLPEMIAEATNVPDAETTGVNYGFDRIRFLSPVRAGADVRARFVLREMVEPAPGVARLLWDVTVDIRGEDKPALVAEWWSQIMARPERET